MLSDEEAAIDDADWRTPADRELWTRQTEGTWDGPERCPATSDGRRCVRIAHHDASMNATPHEWGPPDGI